MVVERGHCSDSTIDFFIILRCFSNPEALLAHFQDIMVGNRLDKSHWWNNGKVVSWGQTNELS